MANLPVISPNSNQVLSKIQNQFNNKIKQIHELKETIVFVREQEKFLRKHVSDKILPMEEEYGRHLQDILHQIDNYYYEDGFSKAEQDKIKDLVLQLCKRLLKRTKTKEVIAVFNRYNDVTYEEIQQIQKQKAIAIVKQKLGADWDETLDFKNSAELNAYLNRKLTDKQGQSASHKKVSQKVADEQKNLTKLVRLLYTDLVKKLHPDLEKEDEKKDEKTQRMHQLTDAYENNDLFELLMLHAQYVKQENDNLRELAEEQIKQYIKILDGQVNELLIELDALKYRNFSYLMEDADNPKLLQRKLKEIVSEIQLRIVHIKQDLRDFQDKKAFKAFIKQYEMSVEIPQSGQTDLDFGETQ